MICAFGVGVPRNVAVQCVLCSFLMFKWAAALLIDVGGLLVVRTTYTFC